MKRTFVFTLFALAVLQPLALTAQTTMFKFNQDGEFASISQSTDPNSSFNLNVSRNSSTGAPTTASLSYLSFTFDPNTNIETFTQIVGAIPASAFTGQNTQNMNLNFDTSQLDPNASTNQTCVVDFNTLDIFCGPGPSGSIQLNFTENGVQRTRVLALGEEITVGNFTTRIHQRSDNASANATGSVFGTPVSASATVGINHNSSLEFVKNH
jgi:hypothetical protein